MKPTPSLVKNLMRRGLRLLVDPEPVAKDRQRVIAFFEHCCAYCGCRVKKGGEDLDHLVSSAKGGRNHISNRVLSCKPCNAQEKREKDWAEFLLEKYGQGHIFEERQRKILSWVQNAGAVPPLPESTLRLIEEHSRKVAAFYDEACQKVRDG